MKRLTVKEYAALTNTSKNAVYKKLETSLKPFVVKENGRTFLCFPDGVDIQPGFNPVSTPTFNPFNPDSTPFNADSTPVQPGFNPDSTPEDSTPVNPVSTLFNPDSTPDKVQALEAEVKRLTDLLDAKEANLKDLRDQLDQERKAGQELRQLMNQQQALTMRHLEEPKKRPLLAAIFPRLYRQDEDRQE